MKKILLDTDIGGDIDDAICLAYLLKEPQCELLGITTVGGESEKRAAVADALCRCAQKRIPIVAGRDVPLQAMVLKPTPDGAEALRSWPHNIYKQGDAPAFLAEKIRAYPHEVTLIAIGNLTNIALLLTDYPDTVQLLRGLFIMNGYFGEKALSHPLENWNSWADPLASRLVFAARPATFRCFPLEVTDTLTMEASRIRRLTETNSELIRAVLDFGSAWLRSSQKLTLHDPLAAVSVFYDDLCRFERGWVQVETECPARLGATDFQADVNGNVEIARSVNKDRFYQRLAGTLGLD